MTKKTNQTLGIIEYDLSKFSMIDARSMVIDHLNEIESILKKIFVNYFKPEVQHQTEFENVFLNNSVVGFGKKIIILYALDIIDSQDRERLLKMGAIRNGFAHSRLTESNTWDLINGTVKSEAYLSVMNSQGKLKRKEPKEYFSEFKEHYIQVLSKLKEMTNDNYIF